MAEAVAKGRAGRVLKRAAAALSLALGCFCLVFAASCSLEFGFWAWFRLVEAIPGLLFVAGGILGLWRPLVGACVMAGLLAYIVLFMALVGVLAREGWLGTAMIAGPALVSGALFTAAWRAGRGRARAVGAGGA